MFRVRFNPSEPRAAVNTAARGLDQAKPKILGDVGVCVAGLARVYFDNLSRGGASFSGRRWPAPKQSTVVRRAQLARAGKLVAPPGVQGIVTGELQNSLDVVVTEDSVGLTYDAPNAKWFTIHRRLIPSRLPTVWRRQLEAIVQGQLDLVASTGRPTSSRRHYTPFKPDSNGRPRRLS